MQVYSDAPRNRLALIVLAPPSADALGLGAAIRDEWHLLDAWSGDAYDIVVPKWMVPELRASVGGAVYAPDERLLTLFAKLLGVEYQELPTVLIALRHVAPLLMNERLAAVISRDGLPSYVRWFPAVAAIVPMITSRLEFASIVDGVDVFMSENRSRLNTLTSQIDAYPNAEVTEEWFREAEELLDTLADGLLEEDREHRLKRFGSIALDVVRATAEGLTIGAAEVAMAKYGIGPVGGGHTAH